MIIFILVVVLCIAGFGILLATFFYSLLSPTKVQERLGRYVEVSKDEAEPQQTVFLRREKILASTGALQKLLGVFASKDLERKIQSANWQITSSEYLLIQFAGGILGLLLVWLVTHSILIGLLGGIVMIMLPGILIQRSIFLRQRKFQDQLVDVLVLIRGAVQAGFSLLQSLDVVIKEMPSPAKEEFGRVQREVQFGIPLSQSLESLSDRMESEDLRMVVTAIIINSQVGGNLSVMLTAVTETIRNRIALMGEVRALTSYARYASYLLTLLPFITAFIFVLLSPNYFSDSIHNPITQILFLGALVGIIAGNFWMRRLAHINV